MSLQGSFGTTAAVFAGGVMFPVSAEGLQQVEEVHRFYGRSETKRPEPVWRIAGSWPERAFYVGRGDSGAIMSLWRADKEKGGWHSLTHSGQGRAPLLDADHYLDGSLLGVLAANEYDWTFKLYHQQGDQALSLPSPGKPPAGARRCKVPLVAKRMASLASGEVFILGYDCKLYEGGARKLAIQRWTKDKREGTVDVMPAPLDGATIDEKTALIAWGAHDVVLGTDKGLAHFNGTAWELIDPSPIDARQGVARGTDGSLWLLSGGQLRVRKTAAKPFEPAALPPQVRVVAIADAPGAAPWVLAAEGNHSVLLGPAANAKVVTFPPEHEIAMVFEGALPAATSACETLFIPLRNDISWNDAAPNKASPKQRLDDVRTLIDKHVRNVRYGTVRWGEQELFGAIPPDYYSAHAVLTRMKSADDKSSARLCCYPATAE